MSDALTAEAAIESLRDNPNGLRPNRGDRPRLLCDVQMTNEQALRSLGPLPSGGLTRAAETQT